MKKILAYITLILIIAAAIFVAYRYNYIPHRKFSDSDFGITRKISQIDADNDGIEDYEDILESARDYLATKPKYKSKYYASTGYPNDEYGVCTDVVAFALGGAGYDLMQLVAEDIEANGEDYDIEDPDSAIDFRRVKNLGVYFAHTAEALTTDINDIDEWQAGDIVIWSKHIGIISDNRNSKGIPFVLHNANPIQASYEEDILEIWGEIVGHYRLKGTETNSDFEDVLDDQDDSDNTFEESDDNTQSESTDPDESDIGKIEEASEATTDNDPDSQTDESDALLTSASDLNFTCQDPSSGKYTFSYNGEVFSANFTTDNWKIIDSYKINNEHDMTIICQTLIDEHPIHGADMTSYRTADDMVYEWFQHNLLYEMLPSDSQWIGHAKDVDFDPKDQNRSFEELYEDRTGKTLSFEDIISHVVD